jgi:uncharacterized protein (TIGR02569 family)
VLKQSHDASEAAFVAALSGELPMVAAPVAADGAWVLDGWTATAWVDGRPEPSRWDDVLEAGAHLHGALAALDATWPPALDERTTPWAIADRVAWGEQPLPDAVVGLAADVSQRARASMAPTDAPTQVVHGDLAGNVLFPASGPPVVIDLAPYRRPVGFATAVAVFDQIAWHDAPLDRGHLVDHSDLARAVVFRVVAAALQSAASGEEEAHRGQRLLDSVST